MILAWALDHRDDEGGRLLAAAEARGGRVLPPSDWPSFAAAVGRAASDGAAAVVCAGPAEARAVRGARPGAVVVLLRDADGAELHRSRLLATALAAHGPATLGVEALVDVPPGGAGAAAGGPRVVGALVVRHPDALSTLRAAVAVLPLLVRAALAGAGRPAPAAGTDAAAAPVPAGLPGAGPAPAGPTPAARVRAGLARRLRTATRTREWRVGVLPGTDLDALVRAGAPADVDWLSPRRWTRFWADPSVVRGDDGGLWVLVEEYDRWRDRGAVAALQVRGGAVVRRTVVLADAHHRALPQAQRVDGRWLATVDTCEDPAPVFTFDAPGAPWRPVPGAWLPPHLVDPALARDGSGWVVTGTSWRLDEASAAETWRSASGPPFAWERDDAAGYADPRYGRGAGPLDPARGVRAVQDCVATYGAAVALVPAPGAPGGDSGAGPVPLLRWDGRGVRVGRRRPRVAHTLSWTPDGRDVAVDVGWDRLDPLAAVWAARELRHLRACRARALQAAAPAPVPPGAG